MSQDEDLDRRIGRAVVPTGDGGARAELEFVGVDKKKDGLEQARERAALRLSGMTGAVMDAMEMALQSEDEGIRVKAAMGLLDRLVPRMRARNDALEEVIEVIPESRKRLLEDIEEQWKKKMDEAGGGGGGGKGDGEE